MTPTQQHLAERIAPPLVELRQYLLHPGRRDELIRLFDAEFVETQEAVGITVIGQFRDLDRPDHFVWIRAFPDPLSRTAALTAFYDGPVWAAHRDAANVTMIDSDDVLLLRPHSPAHAILVPEQRSPRDGQQTTIVIVVDQVRDDADVERFTTATIAELETAAYTLGVYVTYPTENGFPRLPVRSDHVAVWIGAPSQGVEDWTVKHAHLAIPTPHRQILRLSPTRRSLIR